MVSYQIIRSGRKSLALSINKGGELIVRSPRKMSSTVIEQFITDNLKWIETHQRAVLREIHRKEMFDFSNGLTLPWLGENLLIASGKFTKITDDSIVFSSNTPQERREEYFDLLKKEGERYLPPRVSYFSSLMNLSPEQIKITSAKTRWGSCNTNGNICFSRFLLCCAPPLIDYVIVHELAHLEQHNHSTNFYRLVENVLPEYRNHQKALRKIALPF